MKFKIAFILSLFLVQIGICQEIANKEEVKGTEITYKRVEGPTSYGYYMFSNNENNLYKVRQILHPLGHYYPDENDLKYNLIKVFEILGNTFSLERLQQLNSFKNHIRIYMYFLPDGALKEVTFVVHKDSPLDVKEIEHLEQCLKKEIHGWYTEDTPMVRQLQKSNYILLSPPITFEDIISFKKDPGWLEAEKRRRWYGDE